MNATLHDQLRGMSEQELYDALYKDLLTGTLNRRSFEVVGFRAVAVVDMDSLKYLNDNFGHRTGDRYLVQLAQELIHEFGEGSVFRIAGDEFAVTGFFGQALAAGLERVRERFPGISFGVAYDLGSADALLRAEKLRREAQGLRAGRGLPPPWLAGEAAEIGR